MQSAKETSSRVFLRSKISLPAEEVFQWHLRPCSLKRLIPPWEKVEVLSIEGSPSAVGSKVICKIKIGPFSIRFVALHDAFIPGKSFTDVQIQGPFKAWKHIHTVHPINEEECEIEDEILFTPPFAFLKSRIEKRFLRVLAWRHERMKNDLRVQNRYFSQPLRILLSGSSGFVGSELSDFLRNAGHTVVSLTRKKRKNAIAWNPEIGEVDPAQFEDFDAVIHLAGKNLASGFWTEKLKKEIFLSRARDTWLLSQVLLRLLRPPKTMICASAIGIYGNRGGERLTEESPPGTGFLSEVCQEWEKATMSIENRGTRGVHTRFGLILSSKGGMLAKMLPLFRFGLGAILGRGKQWVSWIALDDVIYGIYHALMVKELEGAVNFCAPESLSNETFSKKLAVALHRPLFFRIGEKPLHFFSREMAEELLLPSAKAYPKKLQDLGYQFFYPSLDEALRSTLP